MDDVVHRLARELADAIGASVAEDPKVEACREKARAAGYEMQISLEAVIGCASGEAAEVLAKPKTKAKTKVTTPMKSADSPASLSSRTVLSRPTARGRIDCGKMTVSRRGRIGTARWISLFTAGRSSRWFSSIVL